MKKFTFKGVLDGLRSSVSQQPRNDQEIVETLKPEHFQVAKTFRHGFPHQPTAVAFDPIQRLLAIGTKNGSLRILGRAGVDCHVSHEAEVPAAVLQITFLVNEGALVTATADDKIHLWNFRQKKPDLVHSLQFQRERITFLFLPLQSKWLYVGTERGNVHVVNVESFQLSGYIINWNKAIEVSRKTHPGPVIHLSDNPLDSSKLLIGFETGLIVLWDLRLKQADARWQSTEPMKAVTWSNDGKQFISCHTDGTLLTWNIRQPFKPVTVLQPHSKINKDGKPESCKPIQKVEWKAARSGETFIIFSGGLTYDRAGRSPTITIIHGKATTVLEMEHNVIDFITLCESPYASDIPEPYAIVVVLQNDLVVIDLLSPGFPCFESPYPMDLHECAVTSCTYLADCPSDLIPAFYSVGRSSKRTGFSTKEWPLLGGEWSVPPCSYSEIIITGHADGSIKFWDASAGTLQVLYKLKTNKVFEKPPSRSQDGSEEDPFAVHHLSLCPESRKLAIAGAAGYVVLFKFKKQESTSETIVLDIPMVYEGFDELECSPDADFSGRGTLNKMESSDKPFGADMSTPVKVKAGLQKKPPGFQAVLVCLSPSSVASLSINSSYGLLAYGTDAGAVVIDIIHKVCLLNVASPDLYGGADPYQRVPKSPKRTQPPDADNDRCRSPSIDQLNGVSSGGSPARREVRRSRSQDKLDSSFSRSRSSSMSSLENISSENIQCIAFADTYTKKSESAQTFPTLWFGTSLGSVLTVMLNVPASDIRPSHPVTIGPFGTMFRLKGAILTMSFLDCNGALIPYTFESWKDESKDKRTSRTNSNSSRMSPPGSVSSEVNCDRQFVAIVSEKQAIVAALPSHNVVYKQQLTDTDFVVKAEIVSLKESVCLVCYISSGHITAYSLPSLRPLIDTHFLPLEDLRIARTFCFSNHGNGLFLCSPSEVQKFTVSAEFCSSLSEITGDLFLPHDMPEPPKESFFKGLFGGGARSLDREELFGESSGKASRAVAKHIPGTAGIEQNANRACSEISRAHQMVVERGEKLSQLEERTARMMNEAESFSGNAHQVMLKYKDKKWYQL